MANSVPAAAVIRRPRALLGFTGRKGRVGVKYVGCEIPGLTPTVKLSIESQRIVELRCSGEMRRYLEEHQWRRRLPDEY